VIEDSNRARDHLANERTFLAWVRTSVAIVVFGFAIGRFAIALRQLTEFQGHVPKTTGLSVWMGMSSICGSSDGCGGIVALSKDTGTTG